MARRVFFSFHYQRDIWRVNIVRNSWVTRDREAAGYWDASLWEKTKLQGEIALRRLIDDGLDRTSVTAVLIGSETYARRWIRYEIVKSLERGNGLFGIHIHNIKNTLGQADLPGKNPFEYIYYEMDPLRRNMFLYENNDSKWEAYKYIRQISTSNILNRNALPLYGKLSEIVRIYDWANDGGYINIATWVEKAAMGVRRYY